MKRIILLLAGICFIQTISAQKKPAAKVPTQQDVNAMMKEIQKMQEQLTPEQKKQMEEGMKMAQEMKKNGTFPTATSRNFALPEKRTTILAKIPKLSSAAAYNTYLSQLLSKANITINKKIRDGVEALLSKYKSEKVSVNNLAPVLLMQKNIPGAVYGGIRAAQQNAGALVTQNNLAVTLHQAGYPQYALPIAEYLNVQHPQQPDILNTIGQCYLSLGDKDKAKQFFLGCLRINSNHGDANAGMGLICGGEGRISDAIPYIQKAMREGYSETLEDLVNAKKIKLDFEQMKCKVPEYFNERKIKPVPAATKLEEVVPVLTAREEMDMLVGAWQRKADAASEEREKKMANNTPSQLAARIYGVLPGMPFGKKAMFMVMHNKDDFAQTGIQYGKEFSGYEEKVRSDL